MYNKGVHSIHVLHVQNICNIHVSATHVIHMYFYLSNTPKTPQCIAGVLQLDM